ncbi:MAG: hypothetical protein H0U62_11945 [Actinobacteria bacterium]|nr:hypothetical protein [Actinomycetota bacterium]
MTALQTIDSEPTVREATGRDVSDPDGTSVQDSMDPQAAAELAQELTLVARAMFAQLLPSTAANAIAGVTSRVGTMPADASAAVMPVEQLSHAAPVAPAVPDIKTSEPVTASVSIPVPIASVSIPVASVPVASVPVLSVPVPAPMPTTAVASVPVASVELPPIHPPSPMSIATGPAPQPTPGPLAPLGRDEGDAPADTPLKPARRTMAMLEEISFLDE